MALRPRTFLISLSAATAVGLLAGLQFWANAGMEGFEASLAPTVARHVGSWWSWGLLAPCLFLLAERWPIRGATWWRHLVRHLAAGTLLALVHRPLHVLVAWYPTWGQGRDLWTFARDYAAFSLGTDLGIYLLLVAGKTVFDHRSLLREGELRAARLESELLQAERLALENQLRPHFLFNTLGAIRELLADGRAAEASDAIERLALLLRQVLGRGAREADDDGRVQLRDELRLVEPYLDLMRLRFGERLQVVRDVTPVAADARVPRLLLQPLFENALLHGLEGHPDAGRVELVAAATDGRLAIELRDDGPGPGGSDRRGTGTGLATVRRRLEAQYGTGATLRLDPVAPRGAVVRIELPLELDVAEGAIEA